MAGIDEALSQKPIKKEGRKEVGERTEGGRRGIEKVRGEGERGGAEHSKVGYWDNSVSTETLDFFSWLGDRSSIWVTFSST